MMRLALEAACLHGSEVVCLEMHGTGTPLGDPIEIGAAAAVFGKLAWSAPGEDEKPSHALCLGAVKSTLGHTEPAAGATAICRTLFRCAGRRSLRSSTCLFTPLPRTIVKCINAPSYLKICHEGAGSVWLIKRLT